MEDHRLAPKRHNANDTRRIYWNHLSRSNYSLAKHLTWCQLTWCHRNDNFSSLNIDSSVLFKNHEVITKRVNASSNTKITKSSVPNETTVRANPLRFSTTIITSNLCHKLSLVPSMVKQTLAERRLWMLGLVACAICRLERKYWMEDVETCYSLYSIDYFELTNRR